MKKRNLWLSICCSLFALLCVGGCTPNNAESKEGKEILLASFESYEEMITYHYTNYFGSAKPSKDYVTEGASGAALAVNGRYTDTQKPAIVIDTRTEYIEKSDFTDVSQIKLDVRNDSAYPVNVYFQYGSKTETGLKLSSLMKKTLEVGFAGTVTYEIDRGLVSEFLDLNDVTQLRLVFDAPKDAIPNLTSHAQALQNYRKLHIDNFRAVLTERQIEKADVRKDGELESGDRAEYLAAWYMPSGYVWSPSSISFNTDPAYIKGGNGSLKFLLEGGMKSEGEMYTAHWEMSINQNADISDYHAIGFWLYNAEETKPVALYTHSPSSGKEAYVKTLDYGWNYIEFTINALRDNYGYDVENFLFGFVALFEGGTDYALYLDEMYALEAKRATIELPAGENVGNLYYKRYDEGAHITLPTPTVTDAESHGVKVFAPNGDEVALENGAFTAAQKGEYTVIYSATAKYPDEEGNKAVTEKQILLAVGSVPTFTNADALTTEYAAAANTQYAIPAHAQSEAEVSWEVVLYGGRFSGVCAVGEQYDYDENGYTDGVLGDSPEAFHTLRGVDHRIIYTAKNADGLRAQLVQHVYADEAMLLFSERYEGAFYDAQKVGGDLTVNANADGFVLQTNGTKAAGTLTNGVMLGYQVKFFRFMVYNAGDYTVKFTVNNGMEFTVAPKTYALFNPDAFGYTEAVIGWKMASSDSKMLPLTFTATSERAGLCLQLFRFGVNADAFGAPTLIVPAYEQFYEKDTRLTVENAVLKGLNAYSFTVTAPNGEEILKRLSTDKLDKTVELSSVGEYTITYSVTYVDYDGETKEIVETRKFKVVDGSLTFIEEASRLVDMSALDDGKYMLQANDLPDLTNAGASVASWKVYQFHKDYREQQGDEIYSASDPIYEREVDAERLILDGEALVGIKPEAGYSYRIEYKISAYGEELLASKTLGFTDGTDLINITDVYKDFYTGGTTSGDHVQLFENGLRLTGAAGVTEVNGEFYHAVSLGNVQRMQLIFRNDGASDVFVYFHGAPESVGVRLAIKAKHYATLELNTTALRAWGFLDENNLFGGLGGNKNRLLMQVYVPTNAVNITLCSVSVNANAYLPVMEGIVYEEEYYETEKIAVVAPTTLLNVTEYTVTVKKVGEATPVFTCTNADIGTENGKFKLSAGAYEITYTVEYELGGERKTLTRVCTFIVKINLNDPAMDGIIYDKWQTDEAF